MHAEKGMISGVPKKAGAFSAALRIENRQGKIKEYNAKLVVGEQQKKL